MRNEQQMFELIIKTAENDDKIKAVFMNGSRANKNVPKDIFQDYDIVYVVTDTKPFYEDKHWIDIFGERLYMQCPEENDRLMGKDVNFNDAYGWLIQFADGNRLDLHVFSIDFAQSNIKSDKLCRILLDKDNILPKIPESTDEDYHVKRPLQEQFLCCANEFWWCLNNVAKGLWRREIPYVQDNLNYYIRPELVKMLSWKVGFSTDFSVSVGKSGKYLKNFLSQDEYSRFLSTYSDGNVENLWYSVEIMCRLFDETAQFIAQKLKFDYDICEAQASMKHLMHMKKLPADASEIY